MAAPARNSKFMYAEMLPHEIVERRKTFPVAFLGLGGLEWHGLHMAVGNDALKAERFCQLAAEKSGGFAFPTLWYGEPRLAGLMEANYDRGSKIKSIMGFDPVKYTESYWGASPDAQIESYRLLLRHVLLQLNSLEMRAICLLCGHDPMVKWVLPVVETYNSLFPHSRVFAGTEYHYAANNQDVGGDHAAKWETSYLMYLMPECVDMTVYSTHRDEPLVGIIGEDPRGQASRDIGEKATDYIVKAMISRAEQLLEEAGFRGTRAPLPATCVRRAPQ